MNTMILLTWHTVPKPEPTANALNSLEALIAEDPSPGICSTQLSLQ